MYCEIRYNLSISNSYGEKFDYFLLAQSWPQTSCWAINKNWQNSTCSSCKQLSDSWTLHGLWPNKYDGKHPFHCDVQLKFEPSSLNQVIENQLHEKWPTYKLRKLNKDFWNYEWLKHGTCATELNETNTSEKYFSKTLQLLSKGNMTALLEKVHIQPGNQYDYNSILDAINNGLGVEGQIGCGKNPVSPGFFFIKNVFSFTVT